MKARENRIRSIVRLGVVGLLMGALPFSRAQASGPVIRVIDDRTTGDRWLLVRDTVHPEGPGKMVRVKSPFEIANRDDSNPGRGPVGVAAVKTAPPAIRAGDRVIVEEHSPAVDARFEAVALGSAAIGSELPVQLKIGGKIVAVMALGTGRAELEPAMRATP